MKNRRGAVDPLVFVFTAALVAVTALIIAEAYIKTHKCQESKPVSQLHYDLTPSPDCIRGDCQSGTI